MPYRSVMVALVATVSFCFPGIAVADEPDQVISFNRDVRPLLAEKCFGCHQPAREQGGYVMTQFDRLVGSGESNEAAIVPSNPGASRLLELITPVDGEAEMPPNAAPFIEAELAIIRTWIEQGAKDDAPTRETSHFSLENPPKYSHLPNLSALDLSPDGRLLAVSGFNEVLLLSFNDQPAVSAIPVTASLNRRLIGLSTRIESLQFSPDGTRLAVSGGIPAEFGEVQIWDIATGKLELSKIVSPDSVYGVSWSPDGSKLSFGCTDTVVRVIDAATGEQVLFQGAHEDWVRDTVFSVDGSQLVSVGRDMSCKLIDVATQRFMDNITSITPGVLKGGISSVARHPNRDEVLIGGADGIPKIYRLNRLTKRVIGDDANLVRQMPEMPGRIQSVAVSPDGKYFAAASSLDGSSLLRVFSYEFDSTQPDNIQAIVSKTVSSQSADERKILADHVTQDIKQISETSIPESGIYSIDFHPNGHWIVAGGRDGIIRVIETATGNIVNAMLPIAIEPGLPTEILVQNWHFDDPPVATEPLANLSIGELDIRRLIVSPEAVLFQLPIDYFQLVVQAELADGSRIDVTGAAQVEVDAGIVAVTGKFLQAVANGETEIHVAWNGMTATVPARVALVPEIFEPDFTRDVNPVLTKLGCNAGTCHGSQGGKKGFKLSLRGYDPLDDIRAFTDDMACRRTDRAAPESSLMLLKPSAQVPHEGGKLFAPNSRYYQLICDWIRAGAKLNLESPKVASIELIPQNPTLINAGELQQMRVVARYSDGGTRDVTREAVIETGNLEVASALGSLIKALRRGEAPILARYEGAFTATTLTVMGNRDGFAWSAPESWGAIDDWVAAKWQRMKIQPSELCSDEEFIRRLYLDLTGLPPSAVQVENFLGDNRPPRTKRDELIDQLVGNEAFVEHWSNKWADLLQVNRKYLGAEGALAFRHWIRDQVKSNRPYNEFAHDILTASGSNRENPPASYFKVLRTPEEVMENTTHLFLGTRFNCNKCHDHPFERWTQNQYFETSAFFAQIGRLKDPQSGEQMIGGSDVEGATPLYEIISDLDQGEMKHVRTSQLVAPEFPFACEYPVTESSSRRAKLAAWITAPRNPYFATSYVNRLWGYLLGTGLIEPLDDIRAGNPPSNPELLEGLRAEFVNHNFDVRHVLKLICKSRTYQLSVQSNAFNRDDGTNFSHAKARRLPAEVLFDSIHLVTGSQLNIPGVAPGTRAAALPDNGITLPSGFLETLGRPARESACECERANDLQLGSVLALVSGPDLSKAINDPQNEVAALVRGNMDDRQLIRQLYLRILNRHALESEIDSLLSAFSAVATDHNALIVRRDQALQEFTARLPELETQRITEMQVVTEELARIIEQLDPQLIQRESDRLALIAAAETELAQYKAHAPNFESWQRVQLHDIQWHPLTVDSFSTQVERPFEVLPDRSILLQQKPGRDIYTLVAATDLAGISAVRLELLTHESLPGNGPGLAPNSNLVVTELEMEIAHPDHPDQWQRVDFSSAISNFEQTGFPVNQAIDGMTTGANGWAMYGGAGQPNWATFQLKLPQGFSGGSLLRFKLYQDFDPDHQIGRFRVSISKYHQQVGLGLDESLLAMLAKPSTAWPEPVKQRLMAAFEHGDPQLLGLQANLVAAQKTIEVAPQIIQLREKLARVSQPVPRQTSLVQLEQDVELSSKQLTDSRLTTAQDLAWALINSPSFLFNH